MRKSLRNIWFTSSALMMSWGCSCNKILITTLTVMNPNVARNTLRSFNDGRKRSRSVCNTVTRSNEFMPVAMKSTASRMLNHSFKPSDCDGNGRHVTHNIRKASRRYSTTAATNPNIAIVGLTTAKHTSCAKLRTTSKKSSTYEPPHDPYSYAAIWWHFSWNSMRVYCCGVCGLLFRGCVSMSLRESFSVLRFAKPSAMYFSAATFRFTCTIG
mmetsp:Transcript_8617/g.24775  ORF Transcript_8617/g.24775 Transcript_8617/m.24775 type:complete len:213 (-) Transcript_8617:1934-2572(-)